VRLPRIIPLLLLKGPGLVKTTRFKDPVYLGDPCNTVRIFNEKGVDELVVLDIGCREAGGGIQFEVIADLLSEAFMPLAYGGGIDTVEDAERLFKLGIEKVVLRSGAVAQPGLISRIARNFGTQAVVVCMDVRTTLFGKRRLLFHGSPRDGIACDVADFARKLEDLGAGELILQAVDRDGTMAGYDLELIRAVAEAVDIPVVACGGAGSLADLRAAVATGGASAAAAGSLFVFQGRRRAVLITYPEVEEISQLFSPGIDLRA